MAQNSESGIPEAKNHQGKGCLVTFLVFAFVIAAGYTMRQEFVIPVEGATSRDWNPESFWHYPWGKSIVHKGVDIFAKEGTNVLAATKGIVISKGERGSGGKTLLILGPKWRLHYYAHLSAYDVGLFDFVNVGDTIAKVGRTGNARNRPPHLHYAIITPIPDPRRRDSDTLGGQKMFYRNPIEFLEIK